MKLITEKSPITQEELIKFVKAEYARFGLEDWRFGLTLSNHRYGATNAADKIIILSATLINTQPLELTKEVLLHEIAHALVDGDKPLTQLIEEFETETDGGHNKEWMDKYLEIGGIGMVNWASWKGCDLDVYDYDAANYDWLSDTQGGIRAKVLF